MTVLAVEPKNAGTAVKPVFAGLACWLDAVVLVIGPLLQVVVFLPETDASDTTARVASRRLAWMGGILAK